MSSYQGFIPGRTNNINCVLKYSNLNPNTPIDTHNFKCPEELNYKVVKGSNPDVNQNISQIERQTNAIKYSLGGKIVYAPQSGAQFLGQSEGQPGGMRLAIKNKF